MSEEQDEEKSNPTPNDLEVFGGYDLFNDRTRRFIVQKYCYLHADNKIEADTTKTTYHEETEMVEVEKQVAGLYSSPIFRTTEPRTFTVPKTVPDERFADLLELEKKYTREIKVTEEERAVVEERLYPLVMLLFREKRIKGKFELPAFEDLKLDRLNKRITDLEGRVDALDFGGDAPKNPQVPQD